MKIFSVLFLFSLFPFPLFAAKNKISFWDEQRRGANFFNHLEREERWAAAEQWGISLVRLAPNKWLNGRPESETGDFLIGRPGKFIQVNASDVKYLKEQLNFAAKHNIKVVLTLLSLPEARWKQHNNGVEERGIWEDFKKQETAIRFWKELATHLKDHPALVGYNLRNEPSPEMVPPKLDDWATGDYMGWYEKVKGTSADINLFYQKAVKAIREVDENTPIVLDSGFYATAWGFKVLAPLDDKKVIYSFHMYEPYSYNSQFNKGKYRYPGNAPLGEGKNPIQISWNKEELKTYLSPISEWQKKYQIPSNRIFVGEVGVFRTNAGAENYLKDILEILNEKKWHWAFYSFREDTWAGMDYELGTKKPGEKYWKAIESGKMPGADVYRPNPLSDILKDALHPRR